MELAVSAAARRRKDSTPCSRATRVRARWREAARYARARAPSSYDSTETASRSTRFAEPTTRSSVDHAVHDATALGHRHCRARVSSERPDPRERARDGHADHRRHENHHAVLASAGAWTRDAVRLARRGAVERGVDTGRQLCDDARSEQTGEAGGPSGETGHVLGFDGS